MAFREKSSWVMLIACVLSALALTYSLLGNIEAGGPITPAGYAGYTVVLIVMLTIGHILIASASPKDAETEADERERQFSLRAQSRAGQFLAAGVVTGLLAFLLTDSAAALFYIAIYSLIVSEIINAGFEIALHRKG